MTDLMILLGTIQKKTDTNIKNKIEKTTTWTNVYLESSGTYGRHANSPDSGGRLPLWKLSFISRTISKVL